MPKINSMKIHFIIICLLLSSLLFAEDSDVNEIYFQLDRDENCSRELNRHLQLMKETNLKFEEYAKTKNTILTPYQVTQFEHLFTTRFLHLKTIENIHCEKESVKKLIIQSDIISENKVLLNDFKMRRIVSLISNYKKDLLGDFKKYNHQNTKSETLEENISLAIDENMLETVNKLPLDLDFSSLNSTKTLSDMTVNLVSSIVSGLAKAWGKLSDKTVWRNGRLNNNLEVHDLITSKLKAFDLIYESRNYTLSHYTIPGHFGHVAIWMGTKEELMALGVWDQDFMAPFREQIEKGNNIIEIRKPGIQFVSLKKFINLDEIAVTRIKNIGTNAENIFKNLIEQFNKKYDFKFNAYGSDKITCAELIAFTYGDIQWPSAAKLSVVNIRPDDVAIYTLLNEDKSEFVLYFEGKKDGSYVEHNYNDFKKLFN